MKTTEVAAHEGDVEKRVKCERMAYADDDSKVVDKDSRAVVCVFCHDTGVLSFSFCHWCALTRSDKLDVELFQVGGDVAGDAMVDVVTRTQERGILLLPRHR